MSFFTVDAGGLIIGCSDAFSGLSGYSRAELIGVKQVEDMVAIIRKELSTAASSAVSEPKIRLTEIVRKDGSHVPVWLCSCPAFDGKGELCQQAFFAVEAALADPKGMISSGDMIGILQMFILTMEQSPATIVITDTGGKIEYVNPKFSDLTGYYPAEAVGQNPRLLKTGHTSEEEYKKLWDTILSGNVWKGVFQNKKKNGDLYWESATISPVKDRYGKIVHFIGIKEDITERLSTEERLKQSETHLRRIAENMQDLICEVDSDGIIRYVCPSISKVLGYGPDELIGKSIQPLDHPEERPGLADYFEAIKAGRPPVTMERRFLHADGHYVWLEASGMAIVENGKPVGALFSGRDIGMRKVAQEALAQSEEKYRNLINGIYSEVYIIHDYQITFMNESAWKNSLFHRGKPRNMEVSRVLEIVDPAYKNVVTDLIERYKQGLPFPSKIELKLNLPGGYHRWYDVGLGLISYEDRIAVLANAIDITERKIIEEALKESEQRFVTVANSIMDAIVATYEDGQIVFWNRAAERVFGYSREEVIGRSIGIVATDSDSAWFEMGDLQSRADGGTAGEAKVLRFTGRRKDGSLFPMEIFLASVKEKKHVYRTATIRDITDQITVEEELRKARDELEFRIQARTKALKKSNETLLAEIYERRQAENELNDMRMQAELYVDLMGHDINNLNQIAMGYLEMGMEMLDLGDDNREFITKPLEALKNSSRLIENVKKLQSIRTDKRHRKEIDLGLMLEDVRNEYASISGRDVTINYVPSNCRMVYANDLLRDVFTNLIGNAIKHSTGSPVVEIGLQEARIGDRTCYRVVIEDNGPGIRDELKVIVFNRLQRGQTKAKGSGIGLHLVKTLVEEFGGKVWVEDRVPGEVARGSRFVVMLPAAAR